MRVFSKSTLRGFWESGYADSRKPLESWFAEAKKSAWTSPADVIRCFPNASLIKKNRAVFRLGGNKDRIVAEMDYSRQAVFILFVGTHRQYDKIHAETI